nr:MAG TPA_asm: hypothetical protein [Caudoviricetes sp.]
MIIQVKDIYLHFAYTLYTISRLFCNSHNIY